MAEGTSPEETVVPVEEQSTPTTKPKKTVEERLADIEKALFGEVKA